MRFIYGFTTKKMEKEKSNALEMGKEKAKAIKAQNEAKGRRTVKSSNSGIGINSRNLHKG